MLPPPTWLDAEQEAVMSSRPAPSIPFDMNHDHLYARFVANLEYPAFRVDPLPGPSHQQLLQQVDERLDQANEHPLVERIRPYAIGITRRMVDLFQELNQLVGQILTSQSQSYIRSQLAMCGVLPISAVPKVAYGNSDFTVYLATLEALQALDLILDLLQDRAPKPYARARICGSVRAPYRLVPDGSTKLTFTKTDLSLPISLALTVVQYRGSTNFLDFDPRVYAIDPAWLALNNRAVCQKFGDVRDPGSLVHPARRIAGLASRLDSFRLYEPVRIYSGPCYSPLVNF